MTTLLIAEKPSVARAIADGLAAIHGETQQKGAGYIRVGSDIVTWCVGHLLGLAPPDHYNQAWSKWNGAHLPFHIEKFHVLPIDRTKDQLEVIHKLLQVKSVDTVVNAGDPDREGQMLVDEVLEYFNWKGHTKRLLLNSTDSASVKLALGSMRDNKENYGLYQSAKCRSEADWLVGMNITRAATIFLSRDALVTVGRVQSPTLALLVKRDLDIENFVSKKFWTLTAHLKTASGECDLKHEPSDEERIWDQKTADAIAAALKHTTQTLKVSVVKKKEAPSKPFTLLTFTQAAGEKYGWGAQKCLSILQELYDPALGLTTYPRSDCEYLKDEQIPLVPGVLKAIFGSGYYNAAKHLQPLVTIRKTIFNSKKVEEHHAIIPTGKTPNGSLSGDHLKGWQLVAERFLMCVLPDYEYEETVISFEHESRVFKTTGSIPQNTNESWRFFDGQKTTILPPIKNNEAGKVMECLPVAGKTTPPKRYTEASLQADMAAVAKFVSDPAIKAKLKETAGIGTAATRAAVMETLKKRGFAEIRGKNLQSTELGRSVVAALPPMLIDPGMTALWEDALDRIAKGLYEPAEFMRKINVFVERRVAEMRSVKGKVFIIGPKKTESVQPAQKARKSTSSASGQGRSTRSASARSHAKQDRKA